MTGLTQSLSFGPILTPIYSLKNAEIKNTHQVTQISQNQGSISFQFSMKTIMNFCAIWAFCVQMGSWSMIEW